MANLLDSGADWAPPGVWNDGQGMFEFWLPPEDPVITVTYPGPTPAGGTLDFRYEWSFGSFRPPVEVIVNGAVIRTIDTDGDYHLGASDIPAGSTLALRATRAEPEGELTANGCRIFRIEAPIMFVMQVAIEIDAPACQEHGRVTRAFVSGYKRARIHNTEIYPRERRCLVANLNGAVAPGVAIKRVVWRMETVTAVAMSEPSIEGREARVLVEACYRGEAFIQCEVQLQNGEVYPQTFRIRVLDGPFFGNENTATGPQMLAIDA